MRLSRAWRATVPAFCAMLPAAGCGAAPAPTPRPAPATVPAPVAVSPAPSDPAAALRRPWAHPTVRPGARCPVTSRTERPDPALGPLFGVGPARPAGLGPGAVLVYLAPAEQSGWADRTWGGQKVLWAVDPVTTGPVLVRGRRLDGPEPLAFEDPPLPELLLDTGSYEGRSGGWKDYPSYTRIRVPGCYAYQVDTAAGTWSVVFVARGPRVGAAPGATSTG